MGLLAHSQLVMQVLLCPFQQVCAAVQVLTLLLSAHENHLIIHSYLKQSKIYTFVTYPIIHKQATLNNAIAVNQALLIMR